MDSHPVNLLGKGFELKWHGIDGHRGKEMSLTKSGDQTREWEEQGGVDTDSGCVAWVTGHKVVPSVPCRVCLTSLIFFLLSSMWSNQH